MGYSDPISRNAAKGLPVIRVGGSIAAPGERIVVDHLADSFALERSESEWLLTLLSADELRYIFEGLRNGEISD